MEDASKPSMLKLPNGMFLYPLRFQSIAAIREGTPPSITVVLDCELIQGEHEVYRIQCETYEQADSVGNVLAQAMAEYFPQVQLSFRDAAS